MESELTITEALAEIKTIGKRLAEKKKFVNDYVARQVIVRDPHESIGGSTAAVAASEQSFVDLAERIGKIRTAIQKANQINDLTISGETRTIAGWLNWRREVSPHLVSYYNDMRARIQGIRQQTTSRGGAALNPGDPQRTEADVIVNVNERALSDKAERMQEILGTLDGKLSLANATIKIRV